MAHFWNKIHPGLILDKRKIYKKLQKIILTIRTNIIYFKGSISTRNIFKKLAQNSINQFKVPFKA